jgi:hypothetical protein
VDEGKLTFTTRVFNNSSYKNYVRSEVVEFAKGEVEDGELKQQNLLKRFKSDIANKKSRLEEVSKELDGMDDRKIKLGIEKKELEGWLVVNDERFRIKYEKEEAVRQREMARIEKENRKQEKILRQAQKQHKESLKKSQQELMANSLVNNFPMNSSAMYYSQPMYSTFNMLDSKKRGIDSLY